MSKITQQKKRKKLKEKGLTPLSDSFCKTHLPVLTAAFGKETALFLLNKIDGQMSNYEFPDNFRFYEVGNKSQIKVFEIAKSNGCCGFFEKSYQYENKTYVLGFNYGH